MSPHRETPFNRYQVDRRRHTSAPGYYGVLPRVFPYKLKTSREIAFSILQVISDNDPDMLSGFAVTAHPSDTDGVVTMWFSEELAQYVEFNDICRVEET